MDHFRRAPAEDKDDDPRPSAFSPPSIIRESSSAFSRPLLPTSSSLLSPRPHLAGGANGSSSSSAAAAGSDPLAPASAGCARYRECLRNHAASLGGHVIDGCGEFMPAGPADPLKCAACGCHRSFHRQDPEPDPLRFGSRVPLLLPPAPLRLSGNTTEQSSSEERNTNHISHRGAASAGGGRKKRFRTKFSGEQKEKMKGFADRVGWRVQRKDEGEMERFCSEVGVSRQVLKVWMHNNKHLAKKQEDTIKAEGGQNQTQP